MLEQGRVRPPPSGSQRRGPSARWRRLHLGAVRLRAVAGPCDACGTRRQLDEHFDEFVVSAFVAKAPRGGAYYFPVRRICETGRLDWEDVPELGKDAVTLECPALALKVSGGAKAKR